MTTTATRVTLDVLGTPAPKGSMRAIRRGQHAVAVPGGSDTGKRKLRAWDVAVREAIRAELGALEAPVFVGVAVVVTITFRLRRPAGHFGKTGLRPSAPADPIVKPDLDKLTRATLDALTGSVVDDDARIVGLYIEKAYATPGMEGALVTVEAAPPVTEDGADA